MLLNDSLVLDVLRTLDRSGALRHLVIIGSWSLPIYQHYFNEFNQIPIMRSMDLDFLLSDRPQISRRIDVAEILEGMGFTLTHSVQGEFEKFMHPELEVEFLTQELGRGSSGAKKIDSMNISAQPLRYQSFALDHTIEVEYYGMKLVVPEPTVYLLLKGIISGERPPSQKAKSEKDLHVVKEFGHYLISNPRQKALLYYFYQKIPKSWQRKFSKAVEGSCPDIVETCNSK